LLIHSRTTDSPAAAQSAELLHRLAPRPAACALLIHSRTKGFGASWFLTSVMVRAAHCALLLVPLTAAIGQQAASSSGEVGSKACAVCHADIYRRYSATGMSRSSGAAGSGEFRESAQAPGSVVREFTESFAHAVFSDPVSGAKYRVLDGPDGYRLEFSRDSTGAGGHRLLKWFVGSGRVGRSYLFSLDGFLFQSPVSYYSAPAKWDISPGYQRYRTINLTRPVETQCLQCHASRLQPVAGTQNGFRDPPFLEGGVGCERCHGPGKEHVARMRSERSGPSEIVNPAKLAPARRDSVCAQCHLSGAARIARVRPQHDNYEPGALLSDYSAFFVWAGAALPVMKVTSHVERLEQSRCKKSSGDRMWCGTCHDPHGEPAADARAAFYRARCEKCHTPSDCRQTREARRTANDDCIACHMPKSPVRDTEHAVYTDHSIPRRPAPAGPPLETGHFLVPFWKTPADDRDLGLAYAVVAGKDAALRRRATELLQNAEARNPHDLPVLIQLAQLYDEAGDTGRAMALYERVVTADPTEVAAAVNLGTLRMQQGHAAEAMRLWREALARNPALTGARVNLAVAQYQTGEHSAAEATLRTALEFDPDNPTARRLLAEIRGASR
ncbi:MAG: tetratricopeptide repeat protein, partial [Pseudomonadota bacterium]